MSWSPDSNKLASGTQDGWVQTWDAARGELLGLVTKASTPRLMKPGVNHVAWHPDGRTLAITTNSTTVLVAEPGEDGTEVTKVPSKMEPSHPRLVVAWSPEGDRLAWTGGMTGVSGRSGELLFAQPVKSLPDRLAWSPNGSLLAECGGAMGGVHIRATQSGEVIQKLSAVKEGWKAVSSLAWSPDGSRLAIGCSRKSGNQIRVWQMDTGKELKSLLGHQDSVNALYWLDESRLISLGADRTLRTWNTTTGRPMSVRTAPAGSGVFSPDGSRVAYKARNVIGVWSTETCRIDRTFMVLCEDQYVSITGDGRVDHSEDLRTELVYVLLTEEGQQLTTTPPETGDAIREERSAE